MEKIKEKIVILFDGADCSDGFGSAWIAWKKFKNKAKYIGVMHQSPVPDGIKNKIVYMIDFTYPEEVIKKLIKNNISVTSIDHHISAKKAIMMTNNYSYSENNSGSVLAWKYFFPKKPIPKILKYVEDMDLWKKTMPYSEEIFLYHSLYRFDFNEWNKLALILENPEKIKQCVKIGKALLKYQENLINPLLDKNADKVLFEGHKARAVNSPFFSSQIGNKLLNKEFSVGIIWKKGINKIFVSLRGDGRTDVSKLAKKYGGGGHKNAAGFTIQDFPLPWKTIN
mgnify:CR=1 FL=1